jgi:solute carrier family 6 amino acid transporter-like protein 5/7/9/14
VVCANSATSIYAGFAIFSYLGYMAHTLEMPLNDIVSSGPGLAFIIWPEAMSKLSNTVWICALFSIIFFAMLYSLGISTMIVTVETICTSFLDIFPTYRKRRPIVVCCTIVALFFVGLPLVTKNGIYWFQVCDDYAASYSLVVSAICEMLVISHVYGLERLASDIRMMTGQDLNKFFRTMWSYVTPSILIVTLAFNVFMHNFTSFTFYGKIKHPLPAKTYARVDDLCTETKFLN